MSRDHAPFGLCSDGTPYAGTTYTLEVAKSNRAKCKAGKCRKFINQGALKFTTTSTRNKNMCYDLTNSRHIRCVTAAVLRNVVARYGDVENIELPAALPAATLEQARGALGRILRGEPLTAADLALDGDVPAAAAAAAAPLARAPAAVATPTKRKAPDAENAGGCAKCGQTDHRRSNSKLCPFYKPRGEKSAPVKAAPAAAAGFGGPGGEPIPPGYFAAVPGQPYPTYAGALFPPFPTYALPRHAPLPRPPAPADEAGAAAALADIVKGEPSA
jgi:hypothetical protein